MSESKTDSDSSQNTTNLSGTKPWHLPSSGLTFKIPEPSDWKMIHGDITYVPTKGNEPNWFHRKMQELAFGFKWVKK